MTADTANRAARANLAAAYVDAAPVLAKHQFRYVDLGESGDLVVRCTCYAEVALIADSGSPEPDMEEAALVAMAEHQVAALRGAL